MKRASAKSQGDMLRYTGCALDNVYLANGYKHATRDGEKLISYSDLDDLRKAIGLHIVTNRNRLAPKEWRFLREQIGLTQAEMAAKLSSSTQSLARWEHGAGNPLGPADLLIRALFLSSEIAQPEGLAILSKFSLLLDRIGKISERQPRRMIFRHSGGKTKWKLDAANGA